MKRQKGFLSKSVILVRGGMAEQLHGALIVANQTEMQNEKWKINRYRVIAKRVSFGICRTILNAKSKRNLQWIAKTKHYL